MHLYNIREASISLRKEEKKTVRKKREQNALKSNTKHKKIKI